MPTARTNRGGWKRLEQAARSSQLVPCLGSGVNAHLVRLARRGAHGPSAAKLERATLGWAELLRETVRRIAPRAWPRLAPLLEGGGAATLFWDHLTTSLAPEEDQAASAERRLQRTVRDLLVQLYDREVQAATGPLFDALTHRFEDAITFNFDPLLVAKVGADGWRPKDADWKHSPIALCATRGQTRIWTAHGHASRPESILLGAHLYGRYIGVLQRAFGRHMLLDRKAVGAVPPANWLDLAISRPLVFVGLSLGRDEWTMWWTLVRRARRWARHPTRRPPTFIVTRRVPGPAFDFLDHNAKLVGAELLATDSHEEAWARLADTFGAPALAPS